MAMVGCLVRALYPDSTAEDKHSLVSRYISSITNQSRDDLADNPAFLELFEVLDPETKEKYDPIRKKVVAAAIKADAETEAKQIIARATAKGRAKKTLCTPDEFRRLMPDVTGARICLDHKNSAIEAYYPDAKPRKSASRSFRCRSSLKALEQITEWIWHKHQEAGLAMDNIPFLDDVKEAHAAYTGWPTREGAILPERFSYLVTQ